MSENRQFSTEMAIAQIASEVRELDQKISVEKNESLISELKSRRAELVKNLSGLVKEFEKNQES